jgi:hypothetical protein
LTQIRRVERKRGSSKIEDVLEPISPELVLVSPPEAAERARKLLSQPDVLATVPRAGGRHSRAPVDATTQAVATVAIRTLDPVPIEKSSVRRSKRLRVVTAVLVLVVIAATTATVARQDSARPKASSPVVQTGQRFSASFAPPQPGPLPTSKRTKQSVVRLSRSSLHARKETNVKSRRAETAGKSSRAQPEAKTAAFKKSARLRANASSGFVPSRVFTWPAQPRVTSYIVRFFRDGRGVLQLRTIRSRVAIPSSFRFVPGSYRWQVIPVVGSESGLAPVVDSTFLIRRR